MGRQVIAFGIAAGLIWWRAVITPRLNLPTEIGTLEAVAHLAMGWFACVWVNCPRLTDYYGRKIGSYKGPSPMVPWPNLIPDHIIGCCPIILPIWAWLYQRQWLYFWLFWIPSLFELILVVYQLKNK